MQLAENFRTSVGGLWKPPTAPLTAVASQGSLSLINLVWTYQSQRSHITNVYRSVNGGLYNFLIQVSGNSNSYVDQDLLADLDTYAYQVAHYDSETNNESERADTSTITIYTTMPVPTNLQGTGTINGVVLTWDYTTAAASFLTGFNIRRKLHTDPDQPSSWTTLAAQGASLRTMTDTATLLTGTAYDYQIDALYDGGSSAWSVSTTVTTYSPAPPPPTAPSNLAVTGHSSSSVSLSWTDSPTSGASYVLQYSLNNSTWFDFDTNIAVGAVTYTAGNLNASTLYYFRMYAFTSVGGRSTSPSNTVSQTTDAPGTRTLVQFPDDYTYVGSIHIRGNGAPDMRWARGLTFREDPSDTGHTKHLLMESGPVGPYKVIEFRIPDDASFGTGGATPHNPNSYTTVTNVVNYAQQPYTDASGNNLVNINETFGDSGLGWDSDKGVLWWTQSAGYGNSGWFGHATLNFGAGTAVCTGGRWVFNSPLYKSTSGGILMAPVAYANTYLSGARPCWGYGTNQSVVSTGDVSQGFTLTNSGFSEVTFPGNTLTVRDLACAGNTPIVTSASNPFLPAHVGVSVITNFAGQGSYIAHTIVSYQSAGQVTLNSSAASVPSTNGTLLGIGTTVTDKTKLVGYAPTIASPGTGRGRMTRPTGTDRIILADQYKVFGDTWPANKFYYTDQVNGAVWVDSTEKYGVICLGEVGLRMTYYLNATIRSSRFYNYAAVYDPYKFTPASGNSPETIQPDRNVLIDFPFIDNTTPNTNQASPPTMAMGPAIAVTSIVSDPSKKASNTTGCVVTAPNHGFTGTGLINGVEVYGSTAEFTSIWYFNVIDANSGYIYNPQNNAFWSGATDTQPGITLTRIGPQSGGTGNHGNVIGIAEDPATHRVYTAVQVWYGVNNGGGGGPVISLWTPKFT